MYSRRTYLKLTGVTSVGGIGSLAGCSTKQSNDQTQTTELDTDAAPFELQHSWTNADEKDAITELLNGFKSRYPDITIDQQTVAGRAGGHLQMAVKKRIIEGDPANSWQTWAGKDLQTYIDANSLYNLDNKLWMGKGMPNTFYPISKQLSNVDGSPVTVPLNIHRLNNLFYNVEILEESGIDPATIDTPETLLTAINIIETTADVEGVVHPTKDVWPTLELWESILLGKYGSKTQQSIANQQMRSNEHPLKESLDLVSKYQDFSSSNVVSTGWRNASQTFQSGEAAFFHQGDWAAAEFVNNDEFEFETNWDHMAFPGTEGCYLLSMDSFPFPKPNPDPEKTTKFLQYIASADIQREFARTKGAIPSRSDIPKKDFNPFFRQQVEHFQKANKQLPSIAHGLAIAPEPRSKLIAAMKRFTSSWDVDHTATKIMEIFE